MDRKIKDMSQEEIMGALMKELDFIPADKIQEVIGMAFLMMILR